ncbi:MAG: Methylmalonyl-CoA mutase [Syntrophorhabdus sp. PtaU1.Bin058]|nr:MAG: Methylmalonyl-CoA mutase [Syntrophorhabdus sp. PtaU1.Bin058]
MKAAKKKRVILAKVGLDGHDNGIRIVSKWLMDGGYEVIYAGLYNTPERIIQMTIEENADAIGVSFLSGEHLFYAGKFKSLLGQKDMGHVKLIMGGVITPEDVEALKGLGVDAVFTPGTRRDVLLSKIDSIM